MEAETTNSREPEPDRHSAIAAQEAVVTKFVSLLGMGPVEGHHRVSLGSSTAAFEPNSPQVTAKDLVRCLSPSAVDDHDVVCTLPSFDLNSTDGVKGNDPLPRLGKTQNGRHHDQQKIPEMAASVLPLAAAPIAQTAVRNLSATTSWTKSSLIHAPGAISKGIASSFSSLIDSRTKEWTLVLLRHSLSTGDAASRSQLLSMLSSKVELRSVTTSFKTLPLPESAKGQSNEADVVLPLLFEAVLHTAVQGRLVDKIVFRAPGTISGNFAKDKPLASKPGLTKVEVRLDTRPLLESMMQQARIIVVKAVEHATSDKGTDENTAADRKPDLDKETGEAPPSLSKFTSALSLSSRPPEPDEPPSLQKARASALRLNEILRGRIPTSRKSDTQGDLMNGPLSKSRKNRSVTWNHPLEPPTKDSANLPAGKRPRVQPGAHIRSIKSFGRPHADDVQKRPENATFCEFGRSVGNPSIWGRDGRMRSHPRPEGSMISTLTEGGGGASSIGTRNAAFDVKLPHATSLYELTLNASKRSGEIGDSIGAQRQPFPRTATALEASLLHTATRGENTRKSHGDHI